jgi:hypothetical protein
MEAAANPALDDAGNVSSSGRTTGCRSRRSQRSAIDAKSILEFIEAPSRLTNPEQRAMQLASAAARLVGGESCAIVLVEDVDASRPVLRPLPGTCGDAQRSGAAWTQAEEGALRDAIVSGRRVLVANGKPRQEGESPERTARSARVASIIACPVRIDGTIVGAICVVGRGAFGRFRPDDVAAVEIAGWLVGHALQSSRLQNLLRSQFAQIAVTREAGDSPDSALALSGARSGHLCRILAKSFYREMIKLGFESAQIIGAASEIISQLSGSLRKHKERWQRNEAGRRGLAAELP